MQNGATFLHAFVEANRDLLFFFYGLAYFTMGVAVALQSHRTARLEVGRSLGWLAAFGVIHGFTEWGDLFIPVLRARWNPALVQFLNVLELSLLAVSFACLMQFGVAMLTPLGRGTRRLRSAPPILTLLWVGIAFFILLPLIPDRATWSRSANALARYLLAFPGALTAAYALYVVTAEHVAPLGVPHLVRAFRWAGWLLVAYGVFAGLVVPRAPFFPANWLNTPALEGVIILPPIVLRALIGLGLAIAFIRALDVFDVETERRIEAMEQKQILSAERERIARELHDGVIQRVYTAGLLVESAHNLAEPNSPLAKRLERSLDVLNTAIGDLRRNLGELQATPAGEALPQALERLAADPRFNSFAAISLEVDVGAADLSLRRTEDVTAIVQEALANVVRHARAHRTEISARRAGERLSVTVQDDGVGLPAVFEPGFGLRNMRDRAHLLRGELSVGAGRGNRGTAVRLDIPLSDER
jgi:signal transduction histidine kinase